MNFKITIFISTWFMFSVKARFSEFGNYAALQAMPYFVDKTELLKILFSDSSHARHNPYYFITCPYNFGKNVNFLMVKEFAELEIDEDKKAKFWLHTNALNLFKNLKIGQYPDMITDHMARYPVIYLDLCLLKITRIQNTHMMLTNALQQSVVEYEWLVDLLLKKGDAVKIDYTRNIDKSDATFFVNLFHHTVSEKELDDGLLRVCRVLYEYFNQTRVVLLVDEYEKVALRALITANEEGVLFYEKLNRMLIKVLTEGRNYIKFALMAGTGSLGFSVDSKKYNLLGFSFGKTSKSDFITHYPFLDEHLFTPYYGFVEEEVSAVCRSSKKCDFYENTLLSEAYLTVEGRKISNPASVTDVYTRTHLTSIRVSTLEWIESDFSKLLEPFARSDVFRRKMEEAAEFGYFQYPIKKTFPPNGLKELINLAKRDFRGITKKHVDMFFTIAFEQGYFTHVPGPNKLTFPNHYLKMEVRQQMLGLTVVPGGAVVNFEAVLA